MRPDIDRRTIVKGLLLWLSAAGCLAPAGPAASKDGNSGHSGSSGSNSGSSGSSGSGSSGSGSSGSSGSGSSGSGSSGKSSGPGSGSSSDTGGRHGSSSGTGGGARGEVVWSRDRGDSVEIRYSDGWSEQVSERRYRLRDPARRVVVERPPKPRDFERLRSALP